MALRWSILTSHVYQSLYIYVYICRYMLPGEMHVQAALAVDASTLLAHHAKPEHVSEYTYLHLHPSVYPSIYLFCFCLSIYIYLYNYLSVCLFIYLSTYLSLSISLSFNLSSYIHIYRYVYTFVYISVYVYIYIYICITRGDARAVSLGRRRCDRVGVDLRRGVGGYVLRFRVNSLGLRA